MSPPASLEGRTFGMLCVVNRDGSDKHHKTLWFCRCTCGASIRVSGRSLLSGKTSSCGCLKKAQLSARSTTHGATTGGSETVEYKRWKSMLRRCTVNPGYAHVEVCEAWKKFPAFLQDMGLCPSPRHTVDRIKNELGYSPENCRWATPGEQNRNTRRTRHFTHNGETKCLKDWAATIGVPYTTLWKMVDRGESFHAIVSTRGF